MPSYVENPPTRSRQNVWTRPALATTNPLRGTGLGSARLRGTGDADGSHDAVGVGVAHVSSALGSRRSQYIHGCRARRVTSIALFQARVRPRPATSVFGDQR